MPDEPFQLPSPPLLTDDYLRDAINDEEKLYPLVFDLYKHVGIAGLTCSQIRGDSPDFRQMDVRHHAILIGLLNRMCRLMLSNVALTHEGRFGETMRLLNRCIVESAINIRWLCEANDESLFKRYLADGMKAEVEVIELIQRNIADRGGQTLAIEKRMLASIGRYVESTGLSITEISATPKLHDFKARLNALSFREQDYLVLQKLGSHAIHGTWPDLLTFYLIREESGTFLPADHDSKPHIFEFLYIMFFALKAIRQFLVYISEERFDIDEWLPQLRQTEDLLAKINQFYSEDDFEIS